MSDEQQEFEGTGVLKIIVGVGVIALSVVLKVIMTASGNGTSVYILDVDVVPNDDFIMPAYAKEYGNFKFNALTVRKFNDPSILSFATSFPQLSDENNLLIGTGSVDIRKLVKCKYISIELSAHSLNQGENVVALSLIAKKLKKKN